MKSSKANKSNFNTARIVSAIRREIGTIVLESVESSDTPLLVSVTQVKLAKDLSIARIYISTTGNEDDVNSNTRMLNKRSKSIRLELAKRLNLRRTPELRFYSDTTRFELERIDNLLN